MALKHADGEKDEDVVPWKAQLINNWKEKNNDAERRASEANSSLTEREALDFRAGYLTSITHMDDCDLQDPHPMGMPDFGEVSMYDNLKSIRLLRTMYTSLCFVVP